MDHLGRVGRRGHARSYLAHLLDAISLLVDVVANEGVLHLLQVALTCLPYIATHGLVQDEVELLHLLWLEEHRLFSKRQSDQVHRELHNNELVLIGTELANRSGTWVAGILRLLLQHLLIRITSLPLHLSTNL